MLETVKPVGPRVYPESVLKIPESVLNFLGIGSEPWESVLSFWGIGSEIVGNRFSTFRESVLKSVGMGSEASKVLIPWPLGPGPGP